MADPERSAALKGNKNASKDGASTKQKVGIGIGVAGAGLTAALLVRKGKLKALRAKEVVNDAKAKTLSPAEVAKAKTREARQQQLNEIKKNSAAFEKERAPRVALASTLRQAKQAKTKG